MADKKTRIRKAPTTSQQAGVVGIKTENSTKPSRLSGIKAKLPIPGIIGFLRPVLRPFRWLVPTYFVNSWREVRQVTWPNRRETWRLTMAVFIFAVVFGALIAGVDKVLDLLFKKVILKQ